MFHDVGKLLKITAIVVGIFVSLLGIFAGIQTLNMFSGLNISELGGLGNLTGNIQWTAFLNIFGGPLLGWTVALLLYGFGELIQEMQTMRGKLSDIETDMMAREHARQVKQMLEKDKADT